MASNEYWEGRNLEKNDVLNVTEVKYANIRKTGQIV